MDMYYGSLEIVRWLLTQNITALCTMNLNRHGVPNEAKAVGNRELFSKSIHYKLEDKDITLNRGMRVIPK